MEPGGKPLKRPSSPGALQRLPAKHRPRSSSSNSDCIVAVKRPDVVLEVAAWQAGLDVSLAAPPPAPSVWRRLRGGQVGWLACEPCTRVPLLAPVLSPSTRYTFYARAGGSSCVGGRPRCCGAAGRRKAARRCASVRRQNSSPSNPVGTAPQQPALHQPSC